MAAATPEGQVRSADPAGLERDLRVLVVDDNPTNQEVARALLGAIGVEVEAAGGGEEGLAALAAASFDLVLMDIHMPGMNGVEALAAIRAAGHAALPVVALTADAMAGERDRLLALGFDGYVSKPIDPAELISALGAALDPAPGDDRRACA